MPTESFRIKELPFILLIMVIEILPVNAGSPDTTTVISSENGYFSLHDFSAKQPVQNIDAFSRHSNDSFAEKLFRGAGLATGFGIIMGASLVAMPEEISKWDKNNKLKWSSMKKNFIAAYTLPPVIDHDFWYINYLGHPYQGGFYFNNLRSQGADFWTSAVFCAGQSLIWEYVLESVFEQPSIQDLISTPLAGVVVGELTHRATLRMRKNGFNTIEKIVVCIINPSYAINNGFKINHSLNSK
mgnify:CR=1 FL=1